MTLPSWLKTTLFIISAFAAIYFLEVWGALGILVFILILVTYKLYQKRDAFQAGMDNIETMIFGKPLRKDYWKEGELKNIKIVIGFGKSKWFSWKQLGYLVMVAAMMVLFIILIRVII